MVLYKISGGYREFSLPGAGPGGAAGRPEVLTVPQPLFTLQTGWCSTYNLYRRQLPPCCYTEQLRARAGEQLAGWTGLGMFL